MTELPTVSRMVEASVTAFSLDMNSPQERRLPRASGIGDCARKQGYSMRNVGATNSRARDGGLTQEQGRYIEDLSVELIRAASNGELVVANRQVELPPDFVMTGHPDGQVVPRELAKWDSTCAVCGRTLNETVWPCNPDADGHIYKAVGWTAPLTAEVPGMGVVGFEHKHLNAFGYNNVPKKGFAAAHSGYFAQTLSYGKALGWDKVRVVILAQDSTATVNEYNQNLTAKNPKFKWAQGLAEYNPKLQHIDLDLSQYAFHTKRVLMRAEWLTNVLFEQGKDPQVIMREGDPETWSHDTPVKNEDGTVEIVFGPEFPCGWCPWLQRCLDDGEGTLQAPQLVA